MYKPRDTKWGAGYTTSLRDMMEASEHLTPEEQDEIRMKWLEGHPELEHLWAVAVSDA